MSPTDFLSPDALQGALGSYAPHTQIHLYDTVDSTNTVAKRYAQEDTPALYMARTQTAGRGRLGRSFHSPADTGLYMTVAYTTDLPLGAAARVTAAAAVSAVTAIESLTDKRPAIKWVNDLYLDSGKVAGILAEAVTRADGRIRMIVGLGINLTTRDFPDGLRAPATPLFAPDESAAATPALVGALAGEITRRLLDAATHPEIGADDRLATYRRHLLYVGERVLCTRGTDTFAATLLGVDEDYSLLVEADGKPLTLSSGEISVRRL